MQKRSSKNSSSKQGENTERSKKMEVFTCFPSPKVKACIRKTLSRALEYFRTYILTLGMVLVLIVGVQLQELGHFLASIRAEYLFTVTAFFVCGLQIKSGEFLAAMRSPLAIILGTLMILLGIPALGVEITKTVHFATLANENMTTENSVVQANVSVIGPTEVAVGLQVFYVVPATLSMGAILAVTAGGDKIITLLLMFITNTLGVFTVPPLLKFMTDLNDEVPLPDVAVLVGIMLLTVHLPAAVGRALRLSQRVSTVVDSWPGFLHHLTIAMLLLMTFPLVSKAEAFDEYTNIVSLNLLAIVGYSSIMHVMFLLITLTISAMLKLDLPAKKVFVLIGSHKALGFSLEILGFLPAESLDSKRLMSMTCVIAYLTVLCLDSVVVSKWATVTEEEMEKGPDGTYHHVPQDE